MTSLTQSGPIRLAVLDDYASLAQHALTPEHTAFANVHVTIFTDTINPKTAEGLQAVKDRLQPYHVVSSMRERTPFPAALINDLPNLKLLMTTGMRNLSLDLPACSARSIVVTGTRGKSEKKPFNVHFPPPPSTHDSTTQQCLSLLLSLTSRIPIDHSRITSSATPSAWQSGLSVPLYGKTLGVLGLGRLGTNFGRLCVQALGMNVICWSSSLTQEKADEAAQNAGLPPGVFKYISKEELFRQADVLSLHYVLSDRSRGIVGKEELSWMKPGAFLVNTARAGLIDENAIFETLVHGKIVGAAFDVLWDEPLLLDSRWRTTKWAEEGRSMVVISPHMGYVNDVTISTWYQEQAEELERWLKGEGLKNRMN